MPAVTAAVIAGLAISAAGTIGSAITASSAGDVQSGIAANQAKIEAQKAQAMEFDARQRQLQAFRAAQRTRSVALTNATNQGGQLGSGLQGGYAQTSGQTNTSLLGIYANLDIGRNISSLNQLISGQQGELAQLNAQASMYSGLTSLGGALVTGAGTIGRITSPMGNGTQANAGGFAPNLNSYINPSYTGNSYGNGLYG